MVGVVVEANAMFGKQICGINDDWTNDGLKKDVVPSLLTIWLFVQIRTGLVSTKALSILKLLEKGKGWRILTMFLE